MKVLTTIFEELVPISGGGTPRVSNIVRSLAKRGHEVYVACSIGVSKKVAIEELGCSDLLPLQGVSRLDRRKMIKYMYVYPLNILRVINYARELKPDLIISHNSIAGLSALLAKRLGVQCLTALDLTDLLFEYLEDYDWMGWLKAATFLGRRLEKDVLCQSDRIITISQAMKGIISGYGACSKKIDVVHDGVDTSIFRAVDGCQLRREHAPAAEHVLIFHGVIDPQDGPELLVEAARVVIEKHPATSFWLVGDGTAVPNLKQKVREYGLDGKFFFSGWVRQVDVPRYISASDLGLVILPDALSARGRVTLKEFEYWACGVPAILPRLPALMEIAREGEASLFYQPGDHSDLAAKIIRLLEDDALRREMGMRGQRMVEDKFEWHRLADRFVELCESYQAIQGPLEAKA